MYRVSHIKVDRVKGTKLRFGGQIKKFNHTENFEKCYKANRTFFSENARFFEYYLRILALKIAGDNLI